MIIIGIDPGVSGAICILTDGKITEIYEMPTMIDGKKNKKQVNGAEITNIINKELVNEKDINVVIEHVSAMPGQGVTSMFNFGQSFGVLKGICAALKLPVHFIRPVKWKKHFNLINTEKDASRTKVIEVFPYISSKISKKKDANKADAIIIARFFHETVGNS
jgi:crossover junction endodeoxyribonuclease RuvC